jgi:formylglycine-generating enzyme required for sulfatase activity
MAGDCPTAGGEMRKLPPGYCIDREEVTIGQYAAWIATNPIASPETQIARCASNLNFPPNPICAALPEYGDSDDFPQSCVDWCDAYAFCRAVGKRLCGRIGGGELDYASFTDPDLSQWHHACTSGGVNNYPFTTPGTGLECNGQEYQQRTGWVGPLWGSPDASACQSSVPGYEGVVDLSGNLTEWEDACAEVNGGRFRCRVRGGSYLSPSPDRRCAAIDDEFADDLHTTIGFRCCAY